jgi:hypothetical protein
MQLAKARHLTRHAQKTEPRHLFVDGARHPEGQEAQPLHFDPIIELHPHVERSHVLAESLEHMRIAAMEHHLQQRRIRFRAHRLNALGRRQETNVLDPD